MKRFLIVALILNALLGITYAGSNANESEAYSLPLLGHIYLFVDVSGDAKPFITPDASQLVDQYGFTELTQAETNLGYEHKVHWLYVDLSKLELPSKQTLFLKYGYPLVDFIDVYAHKAGVGWALTYQTGDMREYSSRPIDQVNFYFPLSDSDKHLLLRIRTNGALLIPLSVVNQEHMNSYEKNSSLMFGLFFGALGIMCLYNLFVYLFTRDTSYFYYVSILFFILVYLLAMSGYGYEWVWRENGAWVNEHIQPISVGLIVAYVCLFTKQVLQLPIYFPRLNQAFSWMTKLCFGVALAGFFLPLPYLIHLISVLPIVTIGFVLAAGVLGYRSNIDGAGLFLIAWSAGLVGAIFFALHQLGVLPTHWVFVHGLKFGVIVNTMFLSFGLVSHINMLREENRRAEAQAHENYRLALNDSLTGIPNRRAFDHQFRLEYRRCQRETAPLSVLMVDVDYFKLYNDTYGHRAGDSALATVASVIGAQLARPGDSVFRYGGEEFVVLLPETNEEGASLIAARIVDSVKAEKVPHAASSFGCLTVSVGLATEIEFKSDSLEVVESADERLYQAKSEGRNQYCRAKKTDNIHHLPNSNRPS